MTYLYSVTTSAGERMVVEGTHLAFSPGDCVSVWRSHGRVAVFYRPASVIKTPAK
jgi:hypothetical protein